ncbi:nucleotidyltransferase family protein [Thetidibacter halocola]|uniref:Nucleotidyltransferase family protein n=1 Tax=Thetidibacter halocola TaxID=2827239 RepID=A0A8J7WA13_9RHOB|nr:nucleotidyltransferase family protein [Thetidibacter halocola]MBS0122684.1 nucleotidyltransferase family protein [Thetidibacter halocola]
MQDIAILFPAAGASRRMRGTDKLLEPVDGLPLLRRQVQRALSTGAHVAVSIPDHDHPRSAALAGLPVQLVAVPDSGLGMSASLRRGIGMLPRGMKAAIILPADMPEITTADLATLIAAFRALSIPVLLRGCAADGTPGHPVLFPADCFSALQHLQGDQGARDVLRANAHRTRLVPLPDNHALTDLDTPEAWQAWRAGALSDPTPAE